MSESIQEVSAMRRERHLEALWVDALFRKAKLTQRIPTTVDYIEVVAA